MCHSAHCYMDYYPSVTYMDIDRAPDILDTVCGEGLRRIQQIGHLPGLGQTEQCVIALACNGAM